MPGIINKGRYLETLQTLNELGQTFPSSQKTVTYYVNTSGTTLGWTATIEWKTLIVDQYQENSQGLPDFSQSQVFGYYQGSSTSQWSTGTISLPANMYTGPMLPASSVNVPITVVNVSWRKDTLTYDVNLALQQNWEPGVTIGDPYGGIGFEPIYPTTSTLTLVGPSQLLYTQTGTYVATTDIPIDLGYPNPCFLYANSQLIATAYMQQQTATFTVSTIDTLTTGTWTLYAIFGGIKNYGTQQSNTLTTQVFPGIPLIKDTDNFTPNKAYYFSGESVNYSLTVIPDPSYTPTGVSVTTTSRVNLVREVGTSTEVYNDRFYDGQLTATIAVSADMVDSGLTSTLTNYTITSWSTSSNLYTATYLVYNENPVRTNWDAQIDGKYLAGTTSSQITVASTQTSTVAITDFSIVISLSTSRAIYTTPIAVTVQTPATPYNNPISIKALRQGTSTVTELYSQNHSGTSTFTATVIFNQTGTYTVYATYPGDFGTSISWANRSALSNTATHVATAGYDLPLIFEYFRQGDQDVLRVSANTSTTVTNAVEFYNDYSTFLGSATWVRQIISTSSSTIISSATNVWAAPPGVIFYSTSYPGSQTTQGAAIDPQVLSTSSLNNLGYAAPAQGLYINETYYRKPPTYEFGTKLASIKTWFNPFGFNYPPVDRRYISYFSEGLRDQFTLIIDGEQFNTQNYLFDSEYYNHWANSYVQQPSNANRIGRINPNRYRAWRYYDGTNYNLSTSTAFRDCLDPITTGSWQAEFIQTHNFDQVTQPYAQGAVAFANNSRIYNDNVNNYGWDEYDVYRLDSIGDARGYNVVGINGDLNSVFTVSTSSPKRIYFKPINFYNFRTNRFQGTFSTTTYYIDLVEYIGTITKTNPIRSSQEWSQGQSLSTSTVHLYRFTPEVRQADGLHKAVGPVEQQLNQLPANTYQLSGRANRIPITRQGVFKMPSGAPVYSDQYVVSTLMANRSNRDEEFYGRLQWQSRNTSIESENEYTDFCNAWYSVFVNCFNYRAAADGSVTNYYNYNTYNRPDIDFWGKAYTTATVTTTTVSSATNLQTATLYLSTTTIDFYKDLIAFWPGTIELGPEYGDYNPQELRIPSTATITFASYDNKSDAVSFVPKTTVTAYNTMRIRAALESYLTGYVEFYNPATLAIYTTATVINRVADAIVDVGTFTNTTGTLSTLVATKFVESGTGRQIPGNQGTLTTYISSGTKLLLTDLGDGNFYYTGLPNIFSGPYNEVFNTSDSYELTGGFTLEIPSLKYSQQTGQAEIRVEMTFRVDYQLRAYTSTRYFNNSTEIPIYTWRLNEPYDTVNDYITLQYSSLIGGLNQQFRMPTRQLPTSLYILNNVVPTIRIYYPSGLVIQRLVAYAKNNNLVAQRFGF